MAAIVPFAIIKFTHQFRWCITEMERNGRLCAFALFDVSLAQTQRFVHLKETDNMFCFTSVWVKR